MITMTNVPVTVHGTREWSGADIPAYLGVAKPRRVVRTQAGIVSDSNTGVSAAERRRT